MRGETRNKEGNKEQGGNKELGGNKRGRNEKTSGEKQVAKAVDGQQYMYMFCLSRLKLKLRERVGQGPKRIQ